MKNLTIQIKEATNRDYNAIMQVEELAFGSKEEAQLTANLMNDTTSDPQLTLLAFHEEKPVGHILFTRAYINKVDPKQDLFHILAPLAIIPEYQKQGIGGMLINEGLRILKEMGSLQVFVLGHIEYYPKYGFIQDAKQFGYPAPFPIPEEVKEAWMVQSINPNGFVIPKGTVICADAMNKEEYWRE